LFVPGDRPDRVEKAATLPCDGVIVDLEDAIRAERKTEARTEALTALAGVDFGGRERLLRINGPASEWMLEDVAAILAAAAPPDTIVIPKVDGAEQVLAFAERLSGRGIGLVPSIESARGLLNAAAIAGCHASVDGLFFGAGDYLADVGGRRTADTLRYPRSIVAVAAASARLAAIDSPTMEIGDLAALEDDARAAADLGFAGKAAVHPTQLDVINRVFAPEPERVAWAERVLAAADQAAWGAFLLDGEVVDAMTLRLAERVLAAAGRAT
jgi:citrate lyase beta subunit